MVRGVAEEARRIGAVGSGRVQVHSETVIDVLGAVTTQKARYQIGRPECGSRGWGEAGGKQVSLGETLTRSGHR